jgi:hypothetical protein
LSDNQQITSKTSNLEQQQALIIPHGRTGIPGLLWYS